VTFGRGQGADRGGFTLLEVVLASLVGVLLVVGAFGALSGLERANVRLSVRAAEQAQLDRARVVIDRAVGALVMSDLPPPPGRWRERQPAGFGVPLPAGSEGSGSGSRGSGESEARVEPPPRFVLSVAETGAGVPADWGGGSAPQHLELTVSRPPILPEDEEDAGHRVVMTNHQGLAVEVHSPRGRFELSPVRGEGGRTEYELWWRPLPPRAVGPDRLDTSGFAERPVRVAERLRWAWFEVFAGRKKHADGFSATWAVDLPAYVRFEAMTASGLYVDWLFEPTWTSAPEYTLRTPAPGEVGVASGSSAEGASSSRPGPVSSASAGARRERSVRREPARTGSGGRRVAEAEPTPRGPSGPSPASAPAGPSPLEEPARPVPKPGTGQPRRYDKPAGGG
jgi:hypothetical protein